ncbi:MAG: hypothetical protein DRK00_06060, partial [Thermoprotei archaeon]
MSVRRELRSGLTWRSYLSIIYSVAVFQPAIIYLFLLTGNPMGGMIPWIALMLISELAAMSGSPLTRQEAGTIFICSSISAYGVFLGAIYSLYLRYSPITKAFGLAEEIPPWVSPQDPWPWVHRTFFHSSWLLPLTVHTVAFVTGMIADIAVGLLLRQMYIEIEKLPFPMQVPVAQAIITLAEREPTRTRLFSLTTTLSTIYGLVAYGVPYIVRELKYHFEVIPIPWADFNYLLHKFIPGASFGVATSLAILGAGMMIPFNVLVSGFVGSISTFVVGNWLLVAYKITAFAEEWKPGMSIQMTWQRSLLHAWISIFVGSGIAAGLMPLLRHPRIFKDTISSLITARSEARLFSIWSIVIPFAASAAVYVAMAHLLVPEFPLWILILLNVVWIPLMTMVSTRAVGIMGFPINIPYVHQLVYIASGYEKYDVWFLPVFTGGVAGQGWCINFKIADLCDIDPRSIIKAWALTFPISLLLGFVMVSHFWSLAPIPSATYPGVQVYWPILVTQQMSWIKHPPGIFRPTWIAGSFALTSAAYLVCDFLRLPFSVMGFVTGMSTPIPVAFTAFVGGLLGKLLERYFGARWGRYKPVVVAGLIAGQGIAAAGAAFVVLIIK